MNSNYTAPGVYIENGDSVQVSNEIAIGIGAFVGIAQRGILNQSVRITSWTQYINQFAKGMASPFIAESDLAYAVFSFFQNGGSTCDIVRCAGVSAARSKSVAGADVPTMTAKDEGTWGDKLKVIITDDADAVGKFVLQITLQDETVEVFKALSNTPADVNHWVSFINANSQFISAQSGVLKASTVTFAGGVDGVSDINDDSYVTALQGFNVRDDIAYLAVPGQTSSTVLAGILSYCTEDRKIFPVLEAPKTSTTETVKTLRKTVENRTGALVFPWILVVDPISNAVSPNNTRLCPPSGAYMGIMSRISTSRGIHKAPAGTEATVKGAVGLSVPISSTDLEVLNPAGVVAIKALTNYGICVWGARSLNSIDPNFKYVSDCLLDAYLKRKAFVLGLPYVFESNVKETWDSIATAVYGFMYEMYEKGAFVGNKPEEAFYVKCDGELNDENAKKNNGIILTEIGYANVKPGEFIVFKFSHKINA